MLLSPTPAVRAAVREDERFQIKLRQLREEALLRKAG